jgi:hypothetical protein
MLPARKRRALRPTLLKAILLQIPSLRIFVHCTGSARHQRGDRRLVGVAADPDWRPVRAGDLGRARRRAGDRGRGLCSGAGYDAPVGVDRRPAWVPHVCGASVRHQRLHQRRHARGVDLCPSRAVPERSGLRRLHAADDVRPDAGHGAHWCPPAARRPHSGVLDKSLSQVSPLFGRTATLNVARQQGCRFRLQEKRQSETLRPFHILSQLIAATVNRFPTVRQPSSRRDRVEVDSMRDPHRNRDDRKHKIGCSEEFDRHARHYDMCGRAALAGKRNRLFA